MSRSKYLVYRLEDSYVAFDLETTGLDAKYDSIIELAAVVVENGKETARFQSLVNPGHEIDSFITQLTGITNEMLADAPTLDAVLPDFLAMMQGKTMLGHNLAFDIGFLKAAAEAHGLPFEHPQYMDTMHLARRVFPEWPNHRLCDLVAHLNIQTEGAHRAMADTLAVVAAYDALRAAIKEKGITEDDLQTKQSYLSAKELTAQAENYMPDEDIAGKVFVFTGAMERMTRKDGMQAVLNAGGTCGDNVTAATNYLVLGNAGYCSALKGGKSSKHKKAEALKLKGQDIEVISEDVFLQMLEPNE